MDITTDTPVKYRDYKIDEIDDVLNALALMVNSRKTTDRDRKKLLLRVDYWLDRRLELKVEKGGENVGARS